MAGGVKVGGGKGRMRSYGPAAGYNPGTGFGPGSSYGAGLSYDAGLSYKYKRCIRVLSFSHDQNPFQERDWKARFKNRLSCSATESMRTEFHD